MQKHTKIYYEGMGIHPFDFTPCEHCGRTAVDVHHIQGRQRGSSKLRDTIENLMALCRECHLKAESTELSKEYLTEIHLNNIP